MALISNALDPPVTGIETWEVPNEPGLNLSLIPRGMITYFGSQEIAALGAGDTLRVRTRFIMPGNGFCYLLKSLMYSFASDDITMSMEVYGNLLFQAAGEVSYATLDGSQLTNEYAAGNPSMRSYRIQEPIPQVLLYDQASDGSIDRLSVVLTDVTPTSVAGDCLFTAQFYMFDVEQARKYPLHTLLPIRQ